MLKSKNKKRNQLLWSLFVLCMLAVLGIFFYRVVKNNMVTEMSSGQIIKTSKQYMMGKVLDRYGNEIVGGTKEGIHWESETTKNAFDELLGVNIEDSVNSKMTICGNCSWIYGTEDNCFGIDDFFSPNKERIGGNVKLTLDRDLQVYVYNLLLEKGYENASVVVSNWRSGEIYAAIGSVFDKSYHPGSTMKIILAAATLNIRPDLAGYTYNCTDANHNFQTEEGMYRINCYKNQCHGMMNMEDAITYSCNGYFVSLLQQVPKEELKKELQKWGFDTVVSYEQFMYWDQTFIKESNTEQDYLLGAIGQANVFITPMGLNLATNVILNGGTLQEPVLVKEKQASQNMEWEEIEIEKEYEVCNWDNADAICSMMIKVSEKGTGKLFYYPHFACKTGTAQKSNPDGSLSDRYTVWTTGGLVDAKKSYSVTVCLDDVPENIGSEFAGQIAREILVFLEGGKENE